MPQHCASQRVFCDSVCGVPRFRERRFHQRSIKPPLEDPWGSGGPAGLLKISSPGTKSEMTRRIWQSFLHGEPPPPRSYHRQMCYVAQDWDCLRTKVPPRDFPNPGRVGAAARRGGRAAPRISSIFK
eukprot:gene17958-biopygen2375